MIPVKIKIEDSDEEIKRKIIELFDDIYEKFVSINDNVIDLNTNEQKIKITSVSVDADN